MKDQASLYNERLHSELMRLEDALFSIVDEDKFALRRAWKTLPRREDEDGNVLTPALTRKLILCLLVKVKEQIEAAAEEVAQ